MRHILLGLFPVLFLMFPRVGFTQVESTEQLKKKVLAAWDSILRSVNAGQWEEKKEGYSSRDPTELNLKRVDVSKYVFKRGAGFMWSSEAARDNQKRNSRPTKEPRELHIANPQYSAALTRSKKGSGWIITDLRVGEKNLVKWIEYGTYCPWMKLGMLRLYLILPEADFQFTRIEPAPRQKISRFVRAHFVYHGSRGETSDFIRSGYIDFDPAHSYRPIGYQYNFKSKMEESVVNGTLEYETSEGLPIVKVITGVTESRGKKLGLLYSKEVQTFSHVEYNGHVSTEEFRLSHYGLPEPPGVEWDTPIRWHWWVVFGAIICLIGGAVFFKLRQRALSGA